MKLDKNSECKSYDVITTSVDGYMTACEYSAMITGIACTISKDKSKEELALIASMFYQLGRSVETIAIYGVLCQSKEDTVKEETSKEERSAEKKNSSCSDVKTDKDFNKDETIKMDKEVKKDKETKKEESTKRNNKAIRDDETNQETDNNSESSSYYDRIGIEPRILTDFRDIFDL